MDYSAGIDKVTGLHWLDDCPNPYNPLGHSMIMVFWKDSAEGRLFSEIDKDDGE
jgi:hypothetical protein